MKSYNEKQYENFRISGRILREALAAVKEAVKPGMSTFELDRVAERYIRGQGGEPCFKGYQGYGFSICTSVNEESIHGIPNKNKILKEGDIISIDCGVRFPKGNGGMCTDAARTVAVGKINDKARKLIEVCEKCFEVAVNNLRAGDKISVIGEKIEKFIDGRYGIIDTYFGHGIGESIHESPLIPNFNVSRVGVNRDKLLKNSQSSLVEGTVICIEPMINEGTKNVKVADDGWTVITADGKLAAHFEHTVIVWKNGVEILT